MKEVQMTTRTLLLVLATGGGVYAYYNVNWEVWRNWWNGKDNDFDDGGDRDQQRFPDQFKPINPPKQKSELEQRKIVCKNLEERWRITFFPGAPPGKKIQWGDANTQWDIQHKYCEVYKCPNLYY